MATVLLILIIACILAACVSWAAAVREGMRAMADDRAAGQPAGIASRALLVAWPFAVRGRSASSAAHAARTNKAAIAFFVAVTLGVAVTSAYTNLTMRPHVSAAEPAPGTVPSKS